MKVDESEHRIVLQPETGVEQGLISELFTRLANLSDAPEHPNKIGTELVFYTLDIPEYDDLNSDLWVDAECTVNGHGQLEPEPGSRALVVIHGDPAEADAVDNDESTQVTQEEIDEAVEAVAEAEEDPEDSEYRTTPSSVVEAINSYEPLSDADYGDLQSLAMDASTTGVMDIPANQSAEDIIDDLRTFVETVEVSA